MRKLWSLLLAAVLLFAVSAPAYASSDIRVQLDGSEVTFDAIPFVENGRTLVPVRALSEALGFTVGWDEADQRISLTKGETSISLWVDQTRVVVNGKESQLEVPVRKVGSRTFIPLRFVAETLGAHVAWNQEKQTASVTSGKALGNLLIKGLGEPADQKAEGTIEMAVTIKGDGVPGGELSIPGTKMTVFSHMYKDELLSKVILESPLVPGLVSETAARGGKVFIKADPAAGWMESGTYDPATAGSVYSMSGIQGLDASALQKELLNTAVIRSAGTAEIDGVTVMKLTLDLSGFNIDGLINQFMGTVPLAGAEMPDMKVKIDRYQMSYFVGPESGFVYRTDIDLAFSMEIKDQTGGGSMAMTMKGSINAKPVSEPIQFPSDLPR